MGGRRRYRLSGHSLRRVRILAVTSGQVDRHEDRDPVGDRYRRDQYHKGLMAEERVTEYRIPASPRA